MGEVYVVEGIAGSGKDTYIRGLLSHLAHDDRTIYTFDEASILFSWKHYYLPDIDRLRLAVLQSVVPYVQTIFEAEPTAVFVFDRFHVSFLAHALLRTPPPQPSLLAELEAGYAGLVEALRQLPLRISLALLEPHEIEFRTAHPERTDPAWRSFLAKRVAESRHGSVAELWAEQQETMLRLLEQDGLPYETVRVKPPGSGE